MRRTRAVWLALFLLFSYLFLGLQNTLASVAPHSPEGSTQASSSFTLLIWMDKSTYYQQENVLVTAQVLKEAAPVPDASVTSQTVFPNNTSWFTWTNTTDRNGIATLQFVLSAWSPQGEYSVYATAYAVSMGNVSATTKFTVLIPPVTLTGTLTVATTPVAGEVFVNGTSWGTAPASQLVEIGTYNVSFGPVPSYHTPTWQMASVKQNEETTVTGVYQIEKISCTVIISFKPTSVTIGRNVTISGSIIPTRPNVNISIFDRYAGGPWMTLATAKTDLAGNYTYVWTTSTEGIFELKASYSGDASTLPAESITATVTVSSMPSVGTLTVTTSPISGEIFVNGTLWGLAIQTRVVNVGTYNVSFGPIPKYHTPDWQLTTVSQNVETRSNGVYTLITGSLKVTTIPILGEVFVNGTSWGSAPQTRLIETGTYKISFGAVQGYYGPSEKLATVYENQETTVDGNYIPQSTTPLWLWLTIVLLGAMGIAAAIIHIRKVKLRNK